MKRSFILLIVVLFSFGIRAQTNPVPASKMQQIYNEIKTQYKYGLVLTSEDKSKKVDSPSIFRYKKG